LTFTAGARHTEGTDLILAAFAQARTSGREDWRQMTVAVLKNRILSLTNRTFDERRWGAASFREFVDQFDDVVSPDTSTRPPIVELIGPDPHALLQDSVGEQPCAGTTPERRIAADQRQAMEQSRPLDSTERSAIWEEWGRITRFLEGARLAFAREVGLLTSLQIDHGVQLSASAGHGTYRVDVRDHLRAVQEEETLCASVLIHSYALAESGAAERLGEARTLGGIEDWGRRLLEAERHDWGNVKGGLAGAVEVAVVRNAFAHGNRKVDARGEERLRAAGATTLTQGDPITLDYVTLKRYRTRLRSLLRHGGFDR